MEVCQKHMPTKKTEPIIAKGTPKDMKEQHKTEL